MRIVVLAGGRPRDRAAGSLHDLDAERIRKFGVGYEARFVAGSWKDELLRAVGQSGQTNGHIREQGEQLVIGETMNVGGSHSHRQVLGCVGNNGWFASGPLLNAKGSEHGDAKEG